MMRIIECVPNVSEGRRAEVLDRFVRLLQAQPGVLLLDYHADSDHNRTVFTLIGDGPALLSAMLALYDLAVELIDMRQHRGEHPRAGAVDVCPFVPIAGVTMEDCVALARELGRQVAERFQIPVFLYAHAATREDRRELPNIRKGEFEGWFEKIKDPNWKPDFGPDRVHPTAGITVIGARPPLIAYNVNLGTADLAVADRIARAVRFSSGGFRNVQARGMKLEARQQVQVSMNLLDFRQTPIHRVFEVIRAEAERFGVPVVGSEIVGLVPLEAIVQAADFYLRLENFSVDQVLEWRIQQALAERPAPPAAPSPPTPGPRPRALRRVLMSLVTRAVEARLEDADILEWIRRFRWPDAQVHCPHCGSAQVRAYRSPSRRRVVVTYRCRSCRRRFNDKTGTVFAQTRLPMARWFAAALLIELGAGRRSLQRYLGVDRATARRMWNGLTRDARLRQAIIRSMADLLA